MDEAELSDFYRHYLACLNAQDWSNLGDFVHSNVSYNGKRIGLSGYRDMLVKDFDEIPDLRFEVQLLVCDPPHIASRRKFHCAPKGSFLGLPVNGKKVSFAENVFYTLQDRRIWKVWSVIDKAAIESQLERQDGFRPPEKLDQGF